MIKTTNGEIAKAYPVFLALGKQRVSVQLSLDLFRLSNRMQEYWNFYSEKEQQIVKDCGGIILPNGTVNFPDDPADPKDPNRPHLKQFQQKRKELDELEIELDATPVDIRNDTALTISADEIRACLPFLTV